jgi:hypothetical protein
LTHNGYSWGYRFWDWIHPSQRDLVIDQLSGSPQMSAHYLRHGGLPAISLALSQGGGSRGTRKFPLLDHDGSWEVLTEACIAIVHDDPVKNVRGLFTVLESATATSVSHEVRRLVMRVCLAIREHWDQTNTVLTNELVSRFLALCAKTGKYVRSPALQSSWDSACKHMRAEANDANEATLSLEIDQLDDWIAFEELVCTTEPRLISKATFETDFESSIALYIKGFQDILDEEFSDDDPEEYQSESERSASIAATIQLLIPLFPARETNLDNQASKFQERADSLQQEADELKRELGLVDSDDGSQERPRPGRTFDLDGLFQDL